MQYINFLYSVHALRLLQNLLVLFWTSNDAIISYQNIGGYKDGKNKI